MMNQQDATLFNQAVQLAQSGQRQQAYTMFAQLAQRNENHKNVQLLFWVSYTSPDLNESHQAIQLIEKLEPNNPGLPEARSWLAGRQIVYQPTQQVLVQLHNPGLSLGARIILGFLIGVMLFAAIVFLLWIFGPSINQAYNNVKNGSMVLSY
jgi:hypothetical protein